MVKIVPKSVVEADAKGFDSKPVGTGPYKLTDNGGSSKVIKFERFDDYNGSRPALAAKMNWQIIPDASTRINSLQSKSTQAIDSVPYLNIEQLKATGNVESEQGFGLLFAMFNNDAGNPFSNVKNRQAFLYAINMDRVIETGMSGQASAVTSFLQESHPNYNKASTVYTHDADKAKELFGETGRSSKNRCQILASRWSSPRPSPPTCTTPSTANRKPTTLSSPPATHPYSAKTPTC